jgi:hypothetical protein
MITDENELAALEEHYLGCPEWPDGPKKPLITLT